MMAVNYLDWLAQQPEDMRNRIQEGAATLMEEYQTLQELRKSQDLTQERLAKDLGKSQVSIARMEKRSDLLISTVRSYVEAMGGELNLVVRFPGKPPVILDGLGDLR
jgi:DNA-binding XRE family transcriptional regulator